MMEQVKFKNFITLQRGFDLPKARRSPGAYPLVASSKVDGTHVEVKVEGPGVVTGRSGTLGVVQYIEQSFWPLNTTLWVKDFKGNLPLYVYYYLQTLDLAQYNSGAGVPTLNRNHLDSLGLLIHEPCEQARVAGLLKNYDDLIENNNRRIVILEEMAQSLYREWFVSFRFPGHEDCQFVDSPLGQIPEGWEVKRLDDFVVLQRGFDLPKRLRNQKGSVPVYAASGINGYHDEAKVRPPGLVTGRSGTLGVVNLVLEEFWPLNTSLWVKEFKGCRAFYAYYLLNKIGLEQFNSGAAVPTLNRNDVHGLNIVSPPKECIEGFESFAEDTFTQIEVLTKSNSVLRRQRDMLLPKLISGQMDVTSAELG